MPSPRRFGLAAFGLGATLSLQGCETLNEWVPGWEGKARLACKIAMKHAVSGARDSFSDLAKHKCNGLASLVDEHLSDYHNVSGATIKQKCLDTIDPTSDNDSDTYLSQWTDSCDDLVSNESAGNESKINDFVGIFSNLTDYKGELKDHWITQWGHSAFAQFLADNGLTEESVEAHVESDHKTPKKPKESESKDSSDGDKDKSDPETPKESEKKDSSDSDKDKSEPEKQKKEDSSKSKDKPKEDGKEDGKDSGKSDHAPATLKLFDDSIRQEDTGFGVMTPTLLGASLLLVSGFVALRSWGAGRVNLGGDEELEQLAEVESVEA